MKRRETKTVRYAWVMAALAGCMSDPTPQPVTQGPKTYLSKDGQTSACYAMLQRIRRKLQKGKLEEASRLANVALQSYPRVSKLHVVNGLIYEAMMLQGAEDKSELVAVAYETALKLDPNDFHAAYFMGRFRLRKKEYGMAQECLAHASLLRPEDTATLHDLAAASYYARDLQVARGSIIKLLALNEKNKGPDNPLFYRTAAMIFAATGENKTSEEHFTTLVKQVGEKDPDLTFLRNRMQAWNRYHQKGKFIRVAEEGEEAEGEDGEVAPEVGQAAPPPAPEEAPQQEAEASPPPEAQDVKAPPAAPKAATEETQAEVALPQGKGQFQRKVVILDCFLLRVSEDISTKKGNNILSNFMVNLTPQGAQYNKTVNQDLGTSAISGTLTSTFTSGVTWSTIQYSLNIANALDRRIEVLARPTLSAYEQKKSTFHSGKIIRGGIAGTTGGSIGEVQTGVVLEVSPLEVDEIEDKTLLEVSLEGSLLEGAPIQGSPLAGQTFDISKTKATTTLKLKFGQTGMLGGIYERIKVSAKSGVPLLKDIPFVQYLFSREDTQDERKYVVFFVTPRKAEAVRDALEQNCAYDKCARKNQPCVQELVEEHNWAETVSNASIIFKGVSKLCREFRTGDVIPLYWGDAPNFDKHVAEVSAFLYY